MMRFVIAMEFVQAGIMPQMAARLVSGSWSLLLTNLYVCSYAPEATIGHSEAPPTYLWMIRPEALRSLTAEGEADWDNMERVWAVPLDEASQFLTEGAPTQHFYGEGWRTLVLNGTNLTQTVMRQVAFVFKYASLNDLRADLAREIEARDEEMNAFAQKMRDMPPLSQEKAAELRLKIREFQDRYDFRTNPPTPPSVLRERAKEMAPHLTEEMRHFLAAFEMFPDDSAGDYIELTEEKIRTLLKRDIFEIDDVEAEGGGTVRGLVITPFGRALCEELGNPLPATRAPKDPLADEAAKIAEAFSQEERDWFLHLDALKDGPPAEFRAAMKERGFIEEGKAFPTGSDAIRYTDIGRAVLQSIIFWWRQSETANGDDQKA